MSVSVLMTDVDNTLFVANGTRYLPEPNARVLQRFQKKGIPWGVATGREWPNLRLGIQPTRFSITENGGRIHAPDGESVWHKPIESHLLSQLGALMESGVVLYAGFMPATCGLFHCYAASQRAVFAIQDFCTDFLGPVTFSHEEFVSWLVTHGTVKITVKTNPGSDWALLLLPRGIDHVKSEGFWDLTSGVSKALGLSRVSDLLALPLSQFVVAGDSRNDISMFQVPEIPIKIVVGDHCPELSALGTHFVPDPFALGPVLEKLFLS